MIQHTRLIKPAKEQMSLTTISMTKNVVEIDNATESFGSESRVSMSVSVCVENGTIS
jgi:hypothetical protein